MLTVSSTRPILAASAPDAGRPFIVEMNSEPLYGIKPPAGDPAVQTKRLTSGDVELFLETWLPAPKDGHVPPSKMPTILVVTPYDFINDAEKEGLESPTTRDLMVPRGYAYTQLHVRGTGQSGGCQGFLDAQEAEDAALAIEYLGSEAPWANGVVGGWGQSYPGTSILAAATRQAERVRPYLKAIAVGQPAASLYSSDWIIDGVASTLWVPASQTVIAVEGPLIYGEDATRWADRKQRLCDAPRFARAVNPGNDFTDYYQERETSAFIKNLETPVFMFHGHADLHPVPGAPPINQAGLFEQIPASTPKFGVFGMFGHEMPAYDDMKVRKEWRRADFDNMRIAWFDYWLKGIDSNIGAWPTAQVQASDGQWRGEPDWPFTGGPVGQLALGPAGQLGATKPAGSTVYLEAGTETSMGRVPGTYAVFEKTVDGRLEITGQPVLDLWVELASVDGHVAARLETFDAAGEPIPYGMSYGLRSVQHLEPLVDNRFVQRRGIPAPLATPLNVRVRFQPTDLVVPAGGRIRLTIAGSVTVSPGLNMAGAGDIDPLLGDWSQVSGVVAPVKILHDCDHPSALRFLMPRADPDLLNVQEWDDLDLRATPTPAPVSDGDGVATAPVCGAGPVRLENFGPEIDHRPPGDGIVKSRAR
ncbi:MAG: CocE/NonD family hydrolase [Actinomycetota bacterium]|nr:CocE/NonD family hydrolase [Actinomycetota bacterium]